MRLTSNERDLNTDFLLQTMRLNKISHRVYNPTLFNREWRKHFKEIVHKHNNESEDQINFCKEFQGTDTSEVLKRFSESRYSKTLSGNSFGEINKLGNITLYDPKKIETRQDLYNYRRGLLTSKFFKQF